MTISKDLRGIRVWVANWKVPVPQNKIFIRGATPSVLYTLGDNKNAVGRRRWNITTQERKVYDVEIEIISFVINERLELNIPPNW